MTLNRNFQRELDRIIEENQKSGILPSLLLHACCAPCSSYVLEYLNRFFRITVFFYNPNITSQDEYERRVGEIRRLVHAMPFVHPVTLKEGEYEPGCFFDMCRGLEKEPEGGKRCFGCYRLRLEKTARLARDEGFDYFTTTLSISPLKNAVKLNEIGEELAERYQVRHLPSDFKKRDGFKRSVELSAVYGLYRQNYCGCVYSRRNSGDRSEH